ncbi:MAG: TolC family protein [Bdellovibrionales bacterium]|nr:TolC family protein [Bdellovibrionales bacterium]
MKHLKVIWIVPLAFAGIVQSSSAAVQQSLTELMSETLKTHPAVISAQSISESKHQLLKEARAKAFPTLKLTGSMVKQEVPTVLTGGFDLSPEKIYSGAIELEQPIYMGGRIWLGMELREIEWQVARTQFQKTKQDILAQVLSASLNLTLVEKNLEVLSFSEKTQNQFLKTTRTRAGRGNAKSYELQQAKANALATETRVLQAQSQLEAAKSKQENLYGIESAKIKLDWEQDSLVTQAGRDLSRPLENWYDEALQSRPEAQLAQYNVKLSQTQKRFNFGEHLPSLVFKGRWGYQSLTRETFSDSGTESSEMILALEIPLFSGFSSFYQRHADAEKVASTQRDQEWLNRQIRGEVDQAYFDLKRAVELLKKSQDWARAADAAFKKGMSSYRLGVIDNFQVVQLQTGRESAELASAEAKVGYLVAWISWNKAIGHPLENIFQGQ